MNPGGSKDDPANRSPQREAQPADTRRLSIADQRIDSRDLFVGTREISIAHGEETYRLRLTSQNKLILTK